MMKRNIVTRSDGRGLRWLPAMVGMMMAATVSLPPANAQQDNDAKKILKAMSSYVASQKTLSFTYDADVEVITSELQKIQFVGSGQVQLSRPDKLHATRTGGYTNVDVTFDGKTISVNNKADNTFRPDRCPGIGRSAHRSAERQVLRRGSGRRSSVFQCI